jgi:hypothetical protein
MKHNKKEPQLEEKMEIAMKDTFPAMKRYLEKKAHKHFITDNDKINFTLCTTINMTGNLAMSLCDNNPEHIKAMAGMMIHKLIEWFNVAVDLSEKSKEIH